MNPVSRTDGRTDISEYCRMMLTLQRASLPAGSFRAGPAGRKSGYGIYSFSSRPCSTNSFVYSSVSSAMYFMASLLFRAMATNPALVIFAL